MRISVRVAQFLLSVPLAVAAGAPAEPRCVLVVDIDQVIHPVTVDIVTRAAAQARERRCAVMLMRLSTPGGFADATRQAIERMVASPVPIVTFVGPSGGRAASAGFLLLEAGDVAAMAPGTNTGAAHPVSLTGGQVDAVMMKKIESDAAASLRSLVTRRGRNTELAEKAVLESKSFTEKEALEGKLIDLIARDEQELLGALDGREVTRFDGSRAVLHTAGAVVERYETTLSQKVQVAISDPNIALALLVLGALGLYVEFNVPGVILPGVAGGICLLLGLASFTILPVSWAGVGLLLLSLALFLLEVKVTSHGVLGAGGVVAMFLGALLLFEGPIPEMRVAWPVLTALAVRARSLPVATGAQGMTGLAGVALTELQPEGLIRVRGETWKARAARGVAAGGAVRVTGMKGLELSVEPVENPSEPGG
jgi:membrane-bound serine protease (ClpP class)